MDQAERAIKIRSLNRLKRQRIKLRNRIHALEKELHETRIIMDCGLQFCIYCQQKPSKRVYQRYAKHGCCSRQCLMDKIDRKNSYGLSENVAQP